ncbi:LysM peptidoglycan-binding domain-containing protein [Pontibacter sp. 172403-2]|nr:LysM peptidoglycan-binding domain-containing protein [Pontibacter sp. 172403-2]
MGSTAVRDSVGVERRNGKLFVQHKVEPKETLYSLSRKYNVPVSQIVEANPTVQTTIKIGQIILVPRKYKAPAGATASAAKRATPAAAPAASSRTYTVSAAGNKTHTVQPGQTLYAISRMYNVSVDDIKRWNSLPDNSISIGSSLIVGKGGATPTKKPVYVPEADDEMAAPVTTAPPAAATPIEAEPVTVAANEREEETTESTESGIKKMVESGMAEMIDPKMDSNKYLALHKSAPVGTIMQIKNAVNGQVVYVRVIGKLPNTDENDKVIVRVSKKAYQKLGAVDPRFRVELSYMP